MKKEIDNLKKYNEINNNNNKINNNNNNNNNKINNNKINNDKINNDNKIINNDNKIINNDNKINNKIDNNNNKINIKDDDYLINFKIDNYTSLNLEDLFKNKKYNMNEFNFIDGKMINDDSIQSIREKIKKIKNLYKIYNSDLILKFLTLISYKNTFENVIIKIHNDKNNIDKIIDLFFIKVSNNNLFNFIKDPKNNNKYTNVYDNYVSRDTKIHNLYNKNNDNNNYLLCFSYINILNDYIEIENNSQLLIKDKTILMSLNDNMQKLFDNIYNLNILYELYYYKYDYIDNEYKNIINDNKKIYTIIKERRDSDNINPRYTYNYDDIRNSNYLLLKYINTDIKIDKVDYTDIHNTEYYYFGKFDKFFDKYISNKTISDECFDMIFKNYNNNNDDICIIGYGQSGSGKTSSLIYLDKGAVIENGVIIELCKNKKFIEELKIRKIKISITNIYFKDDKINNDNHERFAIKDNYYNITNFCSDVIFTYNNKEWYNNNNNQTLGAFINYYLDRREVYPTPNNPSSSRSHLIICLTLINDNQKSKNLILCDLAGVENEFNCDNFEEILKFNNNYHKYFTKNEIKINEQIKKEYTKILNDLIFDINEKYKKNDLNNDKNYDKKNNKKNDNDDKKNDKNTLDLKFEFNFNNDNGFIIINDKDNNINNIDDIYLNINKNIDMIKELLLDDNIEIYNMINNNNDNNKLQSKKILILKELNIPKEHGDKMILSSYINYINSVNKSKYNDEKLIEYFKKYNIDHAIYDDLIHLQTKNNKNFNKNIDNFYINSKKYNENLDKKFHTFTLLFNKIYKTANNKTTKFGEFKNKFKETNYFQNIENYFEKIVKLYHDLILIDYYTHNCHIRTKEGYFINDSLYNMKDVIISIIKSSIKIDKSNLPLYFDKEIYPYCRNIILEEDVLNKFYINEKNINLSSVILNTIKSFNVNIDNLKFFIYTVINTTFEVNNPPNPPYININDIYYYTNINYNHDKIIQEISNIKDKFKNYIFYKNYFENNKYYNHIISNPKIIPDTDLIEASNRLYRYIYNNNATTLLGSLETTDSLQSITYNNMVCSYSDNIENYNKNNKKYFRLRYTHKYKNNNDNFNVYDSINDINKNISYKK